MIFYRLWKDGLLRRLDREKLLFSLGLTPSPFLLSRRKPLVRTLNPLKALFSPSYARAVTTWLRYRVELFDGDQG